jgi:adenine-specific DNA-methyltransferase
MLALKELDTRRVRRISSVGNTHKEKFAQYLTPVEIASFMAKITMRYFQPSNVVNVLDPGAGTGILSCALISELVRERNPTINLDAYEIDNSILGELENSYHAIKSSGDLNYQILNKNFITDTGAEIVWGVNKKYDIIIMNPPYQKINTNTIYKNVLHDISIDTVNTYSAFIAIGIKMLADNGVLTAIVPRSFCNGLYFLPFRRLLYDNTAIKHLHIFESRKDNFKEENVLQENIIIFLKKTKDKSGNVTIYYSKEKQFSEFLEKNVTPDDIIDNFAPRFVPGSLLLYAGDTGNKWGYFDKSAFGKLGIVLDEHGKMPDCIFFFEPKNWLVLVESVTSHGPIDSKRKIELQRLFNTDLILIYVTAFPDRQILPNLQQKSHGRQKFGWRIILRI